MFIIRTLMFFAASYMLFGQLGALLIGQIYKYLTGNEPNHNDIAVLIGVISSVILWLSKKVIRYKSIPKNTALGIRNDYNAEVIPGTQKTLLNWYHPGFYAFWWFEIEEGTIPLTNFEPVEIKMSVRSTGGSMPLKGSFVLAPDSSSNKEINNIQLSKFFANGGTDSARAGNSKKQMLEWIIGAIQTRANGLSPEEIQAQKENFIETAVSTVVRAAGGFDSEIGVRLVSLKTGEIDMPGIIDETQAEKKMHDIFVKEVARLTRKTKRHPRGKMPEEKAWQTVLASFGRAQMIVGNGRAITHGSGGERD